MRCGIVAVRFRTWRRRGLLLSDRPSQESSRDAVGQALFAVIGSTCDPPVDRLPAAGPDRPAIELPSVGEALSLLASTPQLTGPAKLEVVDRLRRAQGRSPTVEGLANSLIRPGCDDETRAGAVADLMDRLEAPTPRGADPINRLPADLGQRDDALLSNLQDDFHTHLPAVDVPDCDTVLVRVGTAPALSITSELWTTRTLGDFETIVNPRQWPQCPIQHVFFRAMDPCPDDPVEHELPQPDRGWRATLREVVDFSFGLGWAPMTTDLNIFYFSDDSTIGCTYDLNMSVDGQITVDQGYVIVEDNHELGLRRIRTLKQVHFAVGDLPTSLVCPFWGPAQRAIMVSCLGHPCDTPEQA
jgi:hypothetical protein